MEVLSNKFTVITSVLNGQNNIECTIKSILEQNYINFEYIIIDGGSTDNTIKIINTYKDKITDIISEPDEGIYDAWNKGLKLATGEWICFIGSGDLLARDALEKYNTYIEQNPGLEFISSRIELIDEEENVIRVLGDPWRWKRFKKYMNTLHVGGIHHQSLFEKYGNFNTDFKIAGDYEMLLRARGNLKAGFLDYTAVKMRLGGISASDVSVFDEVEKAKRMHTQTPDWIIRMERKIDMFKFYTKLFLRKLFGLRYI